MATFTVSAEWEKLAKNGGLGNPRHRRNVLDLLNDIERTLAQLIFFVSAQSGLSPTDTLKLIQHLKTCQLSTSTGTGTLDDPTVTILVSTFYAFAAIDPGDSVEEESVAALRTFVDAVHPELANSSRNAGWRCPGLRAAVQLAWGLSLRQLAQNRSIARGKCRVSTR